MNFHDLFSIEWSYLYTKDMPIAFLMLSCTKCYNDHKNCGKNFEKNSWKSSDKKPRQQRTRTGDIFLASLISCPSLAISISKQLRMMKKGRGMYTRVVDMVSVKIWFYYKYFMWKDVCCSSSAVYNRQYNIHIEHLFSSCDWYRNIKNNKITYFRRKIIPKKCTQLT